MISPVKIWRNQKNVSNMLGKCGSIITWSVIRVPPADFMDQAPYVVVLVELDGGARIEAQLVDVDTSSVVAGQRVQTIIRRVTRPDSDGVIPYGIKVKRIE
ncbi:OB-fold domain-containing protein [Candidatus Woesebacteria bacterium]|jgi:uncharacterized OB-fold protein|nr:OB-fold domain-containing protein [Candidatus Woesebacteria bacterium]